MKFYLKEILFRQIPFSTIMLMVCLLACVSICFSPAKAQTCLNSLQDAVNAIGSARETLEVTPGTWAVASSLYIPENISLKVYKGAIIDIESGATLTIAGSLEAGDYRIFGGSGMVDLPAGHANAVWFTSGGNGTVASPWVGALGKGGIGEAIERVVQPWPTMQRSVIVPAGEYSVTETISTYAMGINIIGRNPSLSSQEGSRVHVHFAPGSPKTLFNITIMEDRVPGFVDCINNPTNTQSWNAGIQNIYLTSNNPGGAGNIGMKVVDISMASFRDIVIDNWTGTGIELRGKEITTFIRVKSKATTPMAIAVDKFCTAIDWDAFQHRDMELIGTANTVGSAVIKVVSLCDDNSTSYPGIDSSQTHFNGLQVWQGNQHGFSWVDTCAYGTDFGLAFSNVQSKNASPSGGYLSYIDREGEISHDFFDFHIYNSDGSDRSGGFSYGNMVRNVYYSGNSYLNNGYYMYTANNYDVGTESASLSDSAKIFHQHVVEKWAVKGGTRERLPKAIYLREP